jgi:hypothetical protein
VSNLRNSLARWGRRLGAAGAAAAIVYLLLLLPDREPTIPLATRRQPFAWNQNAFWSDLERQFVEARAAGGAALAGRMDSAIADLSRQLDHLAGTPLPPEASSFAALETNLFQLAPLVAACPERANDYVRLVTRARTEVKRQSQGWDVTSPVTRQRLYRLLFGARMALEEVMLQAPAAAGVPAVIPGQPEPSRTPKATLLGVAVHSGDILVSRGGAPTSALIARGNDFPGNFSHIALVHVNETNGRACVMESHIERGVAIASFEDYFRDKKLRLMVLRLRADLPALQADPWLPHRAATRALDEVRRRHIPYDFAMDSKDHRAQFCSEVASAAYEPFGLRLWMGLSFISSPTVRAWLGSLGVRHFETQEPADLEYDPQLEVVAEWRDSANLFKAHADDAVIDVLFEDAEPGRGLGYARWNLPAARAAKAWSALLNALGTVGPIPEGMSATGALRVKKLRKDHEALVARLLVLAKDFKARHGYTPPYWELVNLARQAKRELGQ